MEIAKKMDRENFSIGAFYNITNNQDNPIKTVGRDVFWAPKPLKIQVFSGSPSSQGSHSPYILRDTTRPRHMTCVLVWSKSDQRRLRKTLHKQTNRQTNRQTDRHYENNGHLAVNQKKLKRLLCVVVTVRWTITYGVKVWLPISVLTMKTMYFDGISWNLVSKQRAFMIMPWSPY